MYYVMLSLRSNYLMCLMYIVFRKLNMIAKIFDFSRLEIVLATKGESETPLLFFQWKLVMK